MKQIKSIIAVIVFLFTNIVLGQTSSEEAINHLERGEAALKLSKNYYAAINEFNKAKELAPNMPESYYKLGQVYLELELFEEARDHLKTYINLEKNPEKIADMKSILNKLDYQIDEQKEYEKFAHPSLKEVEIGDYVIVSTLSINRITKEINLFTKVLTYSECTGKINDKLTIRDIHHIAVFNFDDDKLIEYRVTESVRTEFFETMKTPAQKVRYAIETIIFNKDPYQKIEQRIQDYRELIECLYVKSLTKLGETREEKFSNKIPLHPLIFCCSNDKDDRLLNYTILEKYGKGGLGEKDLKKLVNELKK